MTFKELLDVAKTEMKDLSALPNPDFRLEQAEYKKEDDVWDIVVSYLVENTNKRLDLPALSPKFQFHRIYKRLTINREKEIEGFYLYNERA